MIKKKKHGLLSLGKTNRKWVSRIVMTKIVLCVVYYLFCNRITTITTQGLNYDFKQIQYFLFLTFLYVIATWFLQEAYAKSSVNIKSHIRKTVFEKTVELETRYTNFEKTGSLVATLVDGIKNLENFFSFFFPQIFAAVATALISFFYYFFYIKKDIAIILLIFFLITPFALGAVSMVLAKNTKKQVDNYLDLNGLLLDSIQGLLSIKNLGIDKERTKFIRNECEKFRLRIMRVLYNQLQTLIILDFLLLTGTGIAIYYATWYYCNNQLTLYKALVVSLTAFEFYSELRALVNFMMYAIQSPSIAARILPIVFHEEKEIYDSKKTLDDLKLKHYGIAFENISFQYSPERMILDDVSFICEQGKSIGIVGKSGSGKTTISNLLTCFLRPNSGIIKFGGIPAEKIGTKKLRNLISVVSQRVHLFTGTIRENLLIAKPNATEKELFDACTKAGISEFISSLPKKLDSQLNEKANNLSSGQKQRISLARCVLKDSPILILDEATSNLDEENCTFIKNSFLKVAKNKTLIVISHRLNQVKDLDSIIVLKDASIIEKGTHEELLAMDGWYKEIYDYQAKYDFSATKDEFDEISKFLKLSPPKQEKPTKKLLKKHTKMDRFKMIPKLFTRMKGYWIILMFGSVLFGLLNYVSIALVPTVGVYMMIRKFEDSSFSPSLYHYLFLFSLAIFKGVGAYVEQYSNHLIAFSVLRDIRTDFFKKMIELCPRRYQLYDFRAGDILSRIGKDIENLEIFFAHTISPFIISFFCMVVFDVMLFFIHKRSSLILLSAQLIIAVVIPILYDLTTRTIGRKIVIMSGYLNTILIDAFQGLKTMLLFDYSSKVKESIIKNEKKVGKLRTNLAVREGSLNSALYLLKFLCTITSSYFVFSEYYREEISLVKGLCAITIVLNSFEAIFAVGRVANNLTQVFACVERVLSIAGGKITKLEELQEEKDLEPLKYKDKSTAIEFKNVNFSYLPNEPVLENLNLKIETGQKILLIGNSGEGKSSIYNLILKHWETNEGKIKLFGNDIKEIPQIQILKNLTSTMSQDSHIFNFSIKDNILLGKPEASEKEIQEAIKNANLEEFIEDLPDGVESIAGELGDKMSGGEAQRVALAQIFLRDSPILLFDECTSNLDSLNQHQILESIKHISKGKTVIFISHLYQNYVDFVDKIYKLENGTLKCLK